jgi:chromosome partitioning protein
MKTLALANQKGGVGKSAIACQLAHYYAAQGRKVLFIDLDHQMNSTHALAQSAKVVSAPFSATQLLEGTSGSLPDGDFVLVPADAMLSGVERQPGKHNDYVNRFVEFLDSVASRFDVCILDTNPNPDIRYASALIVAQFLLSPIQLNQEAIDGIHALLTHHRYGYLRIKDKINPALELIGVLPNLIEPTPFQKENFRLIVEKHRDLLIAVDTPMLYAGVRTRTAIAEAQASGLYVADMKKTSAREAFDEIKPCFEAIARRMALQS